MQPPTFATARNVSPATATGNRQPQPQATVDVERRAAAVRAEVVGMAVGGSPPAEVAATLRRYAAEWTAEAARYDKLGASWSGQPRTVQEVLLDSWEPV